MSDHTSVIKQFGAVAAAYSTSAVHANVDALSLVVASAKPQSADRVLDVATGAGLTAFAFAPFVASVMALDLTPAMLEETEKGAKARGLSNVIAVAGNAEAIPFDDGSFELVVCRLAAHHFRQVDRFLSEAWRVLVPGGQLVIVDTTAPENPADAAVLNEIELLRDPSHGRNLAPSEWARLVEEAGFSAIEHRNPPELMARMELETWMARIDTPSENRDTLRARMKTDEVARILKAEVVDGQVWFEIEAILLNAVRA